jgi:hypothetical protein
MAIGIWDPGYLAQCRIFKTTFLVPVLFNLLHLPVNKEQIAKKKQDSTVYPYTLTSSETPSSASATFLLSLKGKGYIS